MGWKSNEIWMEIKFQSKKTQWIGIQSWGNEQTMYHIETENTKDQETWNYKKFFLCWEPLGSILSNFQIYNIILLTIIRREKNCNFVWWWWMLTRSIVGSFCNIHKYWIYYMLEINIMLCINYTSIKKRDMKDEIEKNLKDMRAMLFVCFVYYFYLQHLE